MSTGLPTLAAAGRNARSSARVASLSEGSSSPFASHASAARMPGPPALVRIATRGSARDRLMRQQGSHVEELLEPLGADDAGLAEQRVDHGIAGGERSGVRGGGAGAGVRTAGFDRHDRLEASDPARDLAELLRIAEALEIEQDDAGAGIVGPGTGSDRCPRRRPCSPPRRSWRSRCRAAWRNRGWPGRAPRSAWTWPRCRPEDRPARRSRSAGPQGWYSAAPCSWDRSAGIPPRARVRAAGAHAPAPRRRTR